MNKPVKFDDGVDAALVAGNAVIVSCPPPATDPASFSPPELVGFGAALTYIQRLQRSDAVTLIALDQPTIVPNRTGMRPVEKTVASLISWLGGGVQPANRGKTMFFGDEAPIWRFTRPSWRCPAMAA